MQYIIKNVETRKIEHYCTNNKEIPDGAIAIDDDWNGTVGDHINWYNKKGNKYSDEKLIEKGLIEDNRGIYYLENKTKIEIKSLNQKPPVNGTKKKYNHVTDKLVKGVWEKQPQEKEIYELKEIIGTQLSYLYETDVFVIRKIETKKDLTKEMSKKREEARKIISKSREKLEALNVRRG